MLLAAAVGQQVSADDQDDQVGALVTKLAQQSEELVKRRGLLTTPLETLEAEQEIAALGREFSDELMELLLVSSIEERQDPTDAAPSPLRALPHRGAEKTRAVGRPATTIRLLGGREMRLKTSYRLPVRTKRPGRRRGVGRRGKAGAGCFPHLVALGILCGATPAVLSETSRQVAESSSVQVAQENLKRRGLALGEKTLTRLSQGMGSRKL